MIRVLGYALTGAILLTGFSAFAESPNNSASRGACSDAHNKCVFKCQFTSGPISNVETCETVCLSALDTCFTFADVLEPPAKNTGGGKSTTSKRGDASTGGAVLSPRVP